MLEWTNWFFLQEEFSKCDCLEAKIDKTVEAYGKVVPLSVDYFRRLIEGAVKRIMAIKNYKPSYEHVKSELILFKPTEQTFKTTADDFGLSDICNKSISVYTIEGNHSSILKNKEIVKIINSRLIEWFYIRYFKKNKRYSIRRVDQIYQSSHKIHTFKIFT